MTRSARRGSTRESSSPAGWLTQTTLLLTLIGTLLVSGFVWVVPIEVIEQWAFDRAGSGTYEQFEAIGSADFMVWFWRIVAPLLSIMFWRIWSKREQWQFFVADLGQGLAAATRPDTSHSSFFDRVQTFVYRGLLLAWGVVFIGHSVHGIGLRAHDWPYFRFNSGNVVLPNISESNRAVIRYLQEATPPDARILVASDQKLFFLSYYLRPRTLLHRMHPDSEHVIPLKDQERKLAAYRLEELTTEDLAQMPHDYTLEYFEHTERVDRSQVLSDAAWIAFIRRREQNPGLIPSYLTRLRKVREP